MKKHSYSNDDLIEAVNSSKSLAEVLRKLNLKVLGGNYSRIHERIKELNIDLSHFTTRIYGESSRKMSDEKFIEKNCIFGSKASSFNVKLRLLRCGVLKNECVLCGNNGSWNGEKLTLHLDHINGNRYDNRIKNLRILCPNCHSQTETFGVGNKIKY